MSDYRISITQRAFSDINECVLFAAAVSKEAAKDLYEEIINSINSLTTFPNAYSDIEGLSICGINIRRMLIHRGRYLIIYKVEQDVVTIYDVIDVRKDNSVLKL